MLKALEVKVNSVEEIINIFQTTNHQLKGDNLVLGLQILAKYIDPSKEKIIKYSTWELFNTIKLFSITLEEMIKLRFTKKDVIALASQRWLITEDGELYFDSNLS